MPEAVGKPPSAKGATPRSNAAALQPTVLAQPLEGEARLAAGVRVEQLTSKVEIRVGEPRMVEPERACEATEDLRVGKALPRGRDRGLVPGDVQMAVRGVQIGVLRLHRRRQDDVGEVRRVGEALLDDDGEEILAGEAFPHATLVGDDRGRIRVEDDQRGNGRIVGARSAPRRAWTC